MKLDNLIVEKALAPFAKDIGEKHMPKIVNDVKAMLGRVEKDIKMTDGDWKASATFKLSRKNGEVVQLASNHPATVLLCFGMRLNDIAKNGEFEVTATVPKQCTAWIEQHKKTRDEVPA